MYKIHCDEINPGDNVIVGLGDSFTQGVGAYSTETWSSISDNASMYNISGQFFIEEQARNNWVTQIRDKFLPDYKVYNLGMNGGGNRATIKELYLYPLPPNLGNVIVILMATGIERFDLFKQKDNTAGKNWHQKWQTIWPCVSDSRGPLAKLEKEYLEQIWTLRGDALEFLLNVKDIQNVCKANGYKFMFASAFDHVIDPVEIKRHLDDKVEFFNIVDWSTFISIPNRKTFMDYISQLEKPGYLSMSERFAKNSTMKMPTKYITPCSHWTIEGQFKAAEYLFNTMKENDEFEIMFNNYKIDKDYY
jgi:hypothetical protein